MHLFLHTLYMRIYIQGHHPSRGPGLVRVRQGDDSVRLELGHIHVVGLYELILRSMYMLTIPIYMCVHAFIIDFIYYILILYSIIYYIHTLYIHFHIYSCSHNSTGAQ